MSRSFVPTSARRVLWAARPLAVLAVFFITACSHSPVREQRAQKSVATPQAPLWNDTAHFLAGLKGRADGPFRKLEETDTWRSYAAEFDKNWHNVQNTQFQAVDTFQKRELAPIQTHSDFVFYPLSGPDVPYATHFFPEGRVFLFAGLEPVGHIRPPDSYNADTLDRQLNGWRSAIASIFERSFFVTSEMDHQFRGAVADGLLPTILLLLARGENTIDNVRYGHLTDAGEFVTDDDNNPKTRHQGVEIKFRHGSDTSTRTLYYFSTHLDQEFETKPAFSRFLHRLGTPDTLVKSASFLLHWRMCKALREYILAESNLVLQDDTGVPFRFFAHADWQVSLFGEYSRPDRPFRKEYQPDLAVAFQDTAKVRQLGFSLGYGYGRRPSSMMLAKRVRRRG
jgi:hypothetical protein